MTDVSNPKDIQGEKKPPLHLIPLNAKIVLALAMRNGAEKYGPFNWRDIDIRASAYIGAALRHISLWYDCREEDAKDSGIHHLGHAMATIAILYDAMINEQLVDDRPIPSLASYHMDEHTRDNKNLVNPEKGCCLIEPDDPRVTIAEVPKFEGPEFFDGPEFIGWQTDSTLSREAYEAEIIARRENRVKRIDEHEQAMAKYDERFKDKPHHRYQFERVLTRRLDDKYGPDLDLLGTPEERYKNREATLMKAIDAGHNDATIKMVLDETWEHRIIEDLDLIIPREEREKTPEGALYKVLDESTEGVVIDLLDEVFGDPGPYDPTDNRDPKSHGEAVALTPPLDRLVGQILNECDPVTFAAPLQCIGGETLVIDRDNGIAQVINTDGEVVEETEITSD